MGRFNNKWLKSVKMDGMLLQNNSDLHSGDWKRSSENGDAPVASGIEGYQAMMSSCSDLMTGP